MNWILQKLTSRKFLQASALIVAGLFAMFRDIPVEEAQTSVQTYMAYVPNIVGALVAVGAALGFIKAEAAVDAARAAGSANTK